MPFPTSASAPSTARTGLHVAIAMLSLAALGACGGGGDSTPPTSTVTSASVAASRYGSPAIVTMSGTNLDSAGLKLSSAGCKNITRLTTAPTLSTATTAYYSCTVSGAFSSTVAIQSNGATLANPSFSVPAPQVTMAVTNRAGVNGNIVFALAGDKAPLTVDNFLGYVNTGFYNGVIFHRLVPNFVLQGGGYGATSNGSLTAPKVATAAPIALEATGLSNAQWTIAMANNGGSAPTATSQFFINLVNNNVPGASTNLDGGYAVFGSVTAGIDVVQAITGAPAVCSTNALAGTNDCLPQPDVTITSATQTQ